MRGLPESEKARAKSPSPYRTTSPQVRLGGQGGSGGAVSLPGIIASSDSTIARVVVDPRILGLNWAYDSRTRTLVVGPELKQKAMIAAALYGNNEDMAVQSICKTLEEYHKSGPGEEVRSDAVRKRKRQSKKGEKGETEMKIGRKSLRMSNGTIRHFRSKRARDRFEKVARAYAHGWKGPRGRKRR